MAEKKKSKYDSSTKNWQRIAIWIIALVMAIGTITTFIVVIIANNNPDANPQRIAQDRQLEEYQKQLEAQQKQEIERLAKLQILPGYESEIGTFDAAGVTDLKVETLKEGDGDEVTDGATIAANYTGWTPDGKIFDSTKSDGSDATPVSFSLSRVIEGWGKGLVGVKVGGVYELTIPSDQAYGAQGSGTTIAPDTPLKFVVEVTATTPKS